MYNYKMSVYANTDLEDGYNKIIDNVKRHIKMIVSKIITNKREYKDLDHPTEHERKQFVTKHRQFKKRISSLRMHLSLCKQGLCRLKNINSVVQCTGIIKSKTVDGSDKQCKRGIWSINPVPTCKDHGNDNEPDIGADLDTEFNDDIVYDDDDDDDDEKSKEDYPDPGPGPASREEKANESKKRDLSDTSDIEEEPRSFLVRKPLKPNREVIVIDSEDDTETHRDPLVKQDNSSVRQNDPMDEEEEHVMKPSKKRLKRAYLDEDQ